MALNWLYLENKYMPLIWRLVGFCLIINGLVATTFAATSRPYLVTPLPFIGPAIILPETGLQVYVFLWLGTAACGFPMLFGSRKKAWPALGLLLMCALGALEYMSILCTYIIMTICYLVCLLFDRKGPSPAARLIQIAVAWCYFASAIHKIHPEWLNGDTMYQLFHAHHALYPMWVPLIDSINVSKQFAQFLSFFTIAWEMLLPIGMLVPRTRKLFLILGVLFHVFMTALLAGILPFMPTMLTGYFAFIGNKRGTAPAKSTFSTAFATAFIAVMLITPMRFAVLDKQAMQFSFLDWTPWSMAMFLYDEKVQNVAVQYKDASGVWHDEQPSQRMLRASSDKDLRALTHYVLSNHTDAVEAKAITDLLINSHWRMEKICTATRDNGALRFSITQQ
jgi:hypothetical protein